MESSEQPRVDARKLSLTAWYALWYTWALVGGEGSKAARIFRLHSKDMHDERGRRYTEDEKRRFIAEGLKELMELGVIECERDGEGSWVPRTYHPERFDSDPAVMLTLSGRPSA